MFIQPRPGPIDTEMLRQLLGMPDDPVLPDHPDWGCGGPIPDLTQQMLQLRTGCADTDIIALCIRSMGPGLAGCGGPGLANGRPGVASTDFASRNTFAHFTG